MQGGFNRIADLRYLTWGNAYVIISIDLVDKGEKLFISQKCQYALRAIFELARHNGEGLVKIAEIARAQAIPPRFLEVILSQLKQGKFVMSQRGNTGGYRLIRAPKTLTVGEIIRFIQGPVGPVGCIAGDEKEKCSLYGDCVFLPMWEKVQNAISDVYDNTTIQDLVDQEKKKNMKFVANYAI